MKYDPRIEDYHDIKCFASRNNRECLGKFGYFAEDISEFEDLDKCVMGICCFKDGEDFPFYRFEHAIRKPTYPKKAYPLFCPASATKEKKFRPYTLMEFEDKFHWGVPIRFRRKGEVGNERLLILNGYRHEQYNGQTVTYIYIGAGGYTLQELFEDYEWQSHYTEDYQPFGVEE